MKAWVLSILLLVAGVAVAEETQPDRDEEVNILFIGNSFTARHELAKLVKAVFEEGKPGLTVNTRHVIYGGQNMFTHWTYFKSQTLLEMSTITDEAIQQRIGEIEALAAMSELPEEYVSFPDRVGAKPRMPKLAGFQSSLRWAREHHQNLAKWNPGTKWDYVVLQSWLDVHPDFSLGYAKWATEFAEVAQAQGTEVILYMTAPFVMNREPVDRPRLKQRVDSELDVVRRLAEDLDAYAVVPVPLAINTIQEGGTELTFCYENDFHPNQTTAFLTANMFYAAFFGESPEGLGFNTVTENKVDDDGKDPDGGDATVVFDDDTKAHLQRVAFEAVEAFNQTLSSDEAAQVQ